MQDTPTIADVTAAARRLDRHAVRTPLIGNALLDERLSARILFKAECLQRTGSFKFRGAYNALSTLDQATRSRGVVACSSGNHAQGIAEAARLFGVPATLVMPADAPRAKIERTRRAGAEIVEYDRYGANREEIAEEIARQTGATNIHPYENFFVIAGQGSCGTEIVSQLAELELTPDRVLVCTGGGGLLAGIRLAVHDAFPETAIHTVEPEGYDDQRRSHLKGERLGGNSGEPTICDAIATPMPGETSFEVCRGRLAKGLVVTEEEVLQAVAFAFRELKLVVEPGGAVALAAILSGKLDLAGETVVATLSGGNIDPAVLDRALASG